MKIWAYRIYPGTLTITVATPRAETAASTKFTAAKIHEDYCARVRAHLKEHRHVGTTSLQYPAAKRLQTYFPVFNSDTTKPLYALRELKPAGAPRDFNPEFMLEIMRIKYSFILNLLDAAFLADEIITEAIERHMEYAIDLLFDANSVPNAFIPGDDGQRPGDRTEIDILCELGPADGRDVVDIPTPAQS